MQQFQRFLVPFYDHGLRWNGQPTDRVKMKHKISHAHITKIKRSKWWI